MIRRVGQLLVALVPLFLFAGVVRCLSWLELVHSQLGWTVTLLAGVFVMTVAEVLLFKLWLLPSWAQAISERIYAGNYFPEDDPLVALAHKIMTEHCAEKIPELEKIVKSDSQRTRGWLELARVCLAEQRDTPRAVEHLLDGAKTVHDKEDAAMLMWRAFTLLNRDEKTRQRATEICRTLTENYPGTSYGRLATEKLREFTSVPNK